MKMDAHIIEAVFIILINIQRIFDDLKPESTEKMAKEISNKIIEALKA